MYLIQPFPRKSANVHRAHLRETTCKKIKMIVSTLSRRETHCTILQHIATYCNSLQHTATHFNPLQHTTTPSSNLSRRTIHAYKSYRHLKTHSGRFWHLQTRLSTPPQRHLLHSSPLSSEDPPPPPCPLLYDQRQRVLEIENAELLRGGLGGRRGGIVMGMRGICVCRCGGHVCRYTLMDV